MLTSDGTFDDQAIHTVVVYLCNGRSYTVYPNDRAEMHSIYINRARYGAGQLPFSPIAEVHVTRVIAIERDDDGTIKHLTDTNEFEHTDH